MKIRTLQEEIQSVHEIVLRMISQKDCHSLGETEDTLEDSFKQRVSLDIENL